MSSLKVILESHPIKELNGIIKKIKEGLTVENQNLLALSKDKKRHSKATLIDHILKLDKMGLLKKRPSMYEKPVRAKKEPKKATAKEIKDSLMVPGKYTLEEIKSGKALVKNQPKKEGKSKGKGKPAGLIALESIDLEAEEAKDKAKSKKAKAPAKEENKKRKLSKWNRFVKDQGGLKNAIANKSKYKK